MPILRGNQATRQSTRPAGHLSPAPSGQPADGAVSLRPQATPRCRTGPGRRPRPTQPDPTTPGRAWAFAAGPPPGPRIPPASDQADAPQALRASTASRRPGRFEASVHGHRRQAARTSSAAGPTEAVVRAYQTMKTPVARDPARASARTAGTPSSSAPVTTSLTLFGDDLR